MKNHSPDPFTYCYSPANPRRAAIKDRYGNSIASLINLSEESCLHQNGALFAAAPDLLEALKILTEQCLSPKFDNEEIWRKKINQAEKAIARAEGK